MNTFQEEVIIDEERLTRFINHVVYMYGDVGHIHVLNIRLNPHLQDPKAEKFEIDCPLHPQSECVTTHLWDVYIPSKALWPLVGETACGKFSVWAD